MTIKLPNARHPARKLFQESDLKGPIPSFQAARRCAQKLFEDNPRLINGVNSICVKATGDVELVTFFRRDDGSTGPGHFTLWNFGEFTSAEFKEFIS